MIALIKKLFAPRYRYRSSITGLYVSKAYAKQFPDITVRERIK